MALREPDLAGIVADSIHTTPSTWRLEGSSEPLQPFPNLSLTELR